MNYYSFVPLPDSCQIDKCRRKFKRFWEKERIKQWSVNIHINEPMEALESPSLYSKIVEVYPQSSVLRNPKTGKLQCPDILIGDEVDIDKNEILKLGLENRNLRLGAISHYKSDDEIFIRLGEQEVEIGNEKVAGYVPLHPNATDKTLNWAINYDASIPDIASNQNASSEFLTRLFENINQRRKNHDSNNYPSWNRILNYCQTLILQNKNSPNKIYEMAINSDEPFVRERCVYSPYTPLYILFEALGDEEDYIADLAANKIRERRGDII